MGDCCLISYTQNYCFILWNYKSGLTEAFLSHAIEISNFHENLSQNPFSLLKTNRKSRFEVKYRNVYR